MSSMKHLAVCSFVAVALAVAFDVTPSASAQPTTSDEPVGVVPVGELAAASNGSPFITCMLCIYVSGNHALGCEECCDEPDELEENQDCAACGGTSQCHEEPQPGPCHQDCPGLPTDDDVDVAVLVASIDRGDETFVSNVVRDYPMSVRFVRARGAIQITNESCGRGIVANIPLPTEWADRWAANLPNAETQ